VRLFFLIYNASWRSTKTNDKKTLTGSLAKDKNLRAKRQWSQSICSTQLGHGRKNFEPEEDRQKLTD